jgi:hypothetical protein
MEYSEKNVEIQKELFEEIQKRLSAQHSLVDTVSEVLGVGIDSAYRRIRGEKLLSIKETSVLCRRFKISFDRLTDVRDERRFDCVYRPVNLSIPDDYYEYMLAMSNSSEKLKTSPGSSMLMSAMDIPMMHILTQKELTFFKLYTWSQSVYNYAGRLDDFIKEINTPKITACFQKIIGNYELVPSSEIWMDDTILTTLRLIGYYLDIGCFSNKNFPLLLCEQVMNILNRLQNWTKTGQKGERETPFRFYVSEMNLENTYLLMKRPETSNCLVKLFTINSLNIFDQKFCRETEEWLNRLAQRSTLLCGSSEKERIRFFNAQQQKVRFLMDKIEKLF